MASANGKIRGIFERPKASGIWWARWCDQHGRLHREKAGPKGLAKALYEKRKTDVREAHFFPEQVGRQRVILFDELAQDFLAYSKLHKRSHALDAQMARRLLEAFARRPAKAITALEIDHFKGTLRVKLKLSPATVNRHLELLSSIFSLGARNGKVERNPMRDVKFFKLNNARVRYLTKEEEPRLFRALLPRHRALVEVGLLTGLRASNLIGLQWSKVDLDAAVFTVPDSKSGEALRLEMHPRVREILASLPRNGIYVFAGENGKPPLGSFTRTFAKAVRRAGISDFHLHDLRHTWASWLAMAGVDLLTIMALGGWKTLKMVQRYAHLSPDHKRQALARLIPPRTDTATDTGQGSPSAESSGENGNDAKPLGPEAGVDPE